MGRAIARSFALDGDRVVILGRRREILAETAAKLNAESGSELVTFHAADLSQPDQVEPLPELIGDVDVVVNCAGGVDRSDTDTLEQLRDSFARDFAGNVLAAALLTAALLPRLRRPGGRIITIQLDRRPSGRRRVLLGGQGRGHRLDLPDGRGARARGHHRERGRARLR